MKKGYFLIFIATIFFAGNYIGLKYVFNSIDTVSPQNAAFWGLLASGFLSSPIYLRSRISREKLKISLAQDGKILVLVSLLSAVGSILWFIALSKSNIGPLSLLVKSSTIFSIFLGIFVLKEKTGPFEISGIIVSILGLAMISTLGKEIDPESVLYILFSSFLFSLQSFFIRKYAPNIQGREFAFLRVFTMALFLGIIFLIQGSAGLIPLTSFLFLGLAVSSGALIGRALYFEAHKYLEISKLNIFALWEPVILIIAGTFLFNEGLTTKKVIGALMIISGLYLTLHPQIKYSRHQSISKGPP